MRFRGTLCQAMLLNRMAQSVDKVGNEAVLEISPTTIRLIVASTEAADGLAAYAQCETNAILYPNERKIESLHHNIIALVVNLKNLQRCLHLGQDETEIKIRLTKKNNQPVLEFEAARAFSVVTVLKVQVLSRQQQDLYREQELPPPEVNLYLPELRLLKQALERMKAVQNEITLETSGDGELLLAVETQHATISTLFKKLHVVTGASSVGDDPEATKRVRVQVDLRGLLRTVACSNLVPKNVGCACIPGRAVVVHAVANDAKCTYYVPLRAEDIDMTAGA